MRIDLYLDPLPSRERVHNLFRFLLQSGIAPEGAALRVVPAHAAASVPEHAAFPRVDTPGTADLEVAFLGEKRLQNAALFKNHHLPKLLVGRHGLPEGAVRASVPFEHKRRLSRWLRPVLEAADAFGWPADLLYCDHGFVTKEIVKLAEWFHLDAVKEAMSEWLTQDVEKVLEGLIQDFPNVQVHAGVGHLRALLEEQARGPVFLLGSLHSGYTLPGRHHGLNYAALLTRGGGSGYFLAE